MALLVAKLITGLLLLTSVMTDGCGYPDTDPATDVIFVLDETSSMDPSEFQLQIDFVTNMIGLFKTYAAETQVGLMTFSSDTKTHFTLNELTLEEAQQVAGSITSRGGYTNLVEAMERMLDLFSTARTGVNKVTFLVTDGLGGGIKQLKIDADKAKADGIVIIGVGVGQSVSPKSMAVIAHTPDHYLHAEDFTNTEADLQLVLGQLLCEAKLNLYVNAGRFLREVWVNGIRQKNYSPKKCDRKKNTACVLSDVEAPTVIAVKWKNTNGKGGAIVSMSDGSLVSDGTWKCSNTKQSGWTDPGFDDTNWAYCNEFDAEKSREKYNRGLATVGFVEGANWIAKGNLRDVGNFYARKKIQ